MSRKVFAVPILIGLAACQTITYSSRQQPAIPHAKPGSSITRTVSTSDYSHFLFWGLIPVSPTNVNQELQPLLQPGEAVGQIRITESNDFPSEIAAVLTLGLYRPRHVDIQADVHGASR